MSVDVRELGEDTVQRAWSRLRRVNGQVQAIERMLHEGEECDQVLRQIAAASNALRRVGVVLAVEGIEKCVRDADDTVAATDLDRFRRAFLELS